MNRIKARLAQTSESWIASIVLVLNLVKLAGQAFIALIEGFLTYLAPIFRLLTAKNVTKRIWHIKQACSPSQMYRTYSDRHFAVAVDFIGNYILRYYKFNEIGLFQQTLIKFGKNIELVYGKALREEDRTCGEFPVYGSSGIVGYHNTCIAKAPGIVVGRKGNVGSVFWVTKDFYPIDTSFYVKSEISLFYLYYNLLGQNFIEGDAAVPGLNRNQAYSNLIILPNENLLKKFDEIIKPIFEMIENLLQQNDQLRQIRDRLLPRLISGKLKIKEEILLNSETEKNTN